MVCSLFSEHVIKWSYSMLQSKYAIWAMDLVVQQALFRVSLCIAYTGVALSMQAMLITEK